MKKYIILLLIITFIINACEKDDICLLPTTPKLILRFYDSAKPSEFKKVEWFSAVAQSKVKDSLFKEQNLDSIAIPLNVNATKTVYFLKTNTVSGNRPDNKFEKITINYTTEEVFVSRSCGFKTIFNNVTITSNNSWIQSFTPNSLTTIDNETSAHVKIYH
jgi:hypothetical protein